MPLVATAMVVHSRWALRPNAVTMLAPRKPPRVLHQRSSMSVRPRAKMYWLDSMSRLNRNE
ncbi:hypothetical protein CFELI_14085 [Corynebacterium felinum]|nr:hypothetical protein CFELI_14085 [Corynebacterium felinum]